MSLNWETGKCAAYKKAKAAKMALEIVKPDAKVDDINEECGMSDFIALRDTLVWATLHTKFPKGAWGITEANWQEMFVRFAIHEKLYGAGRRSSEQEWYITPEEVQSMIGLSTNAGNYTDKQFDAETARRLRIDASAALRRWKEKQEG